MPAFPFIYATHSGIVPNIEEDQTQEIQAVIDSLNQKAGIIWFDPGIYKVTQLRLPIGVSIWGSGIASPPHTGTVFFQPNGVDKSLFINDPGQLGPTDYMHWNQFRNFAMRKEEPVIDTIGSGFDLSCRIGEGFDLSHIMAVGFPESGIKLRNGGEPAWGVHDIHCFRNGQYGIDCNKGGGDAWFPLHLDKISGDNNGKALIRVGTVGNAHETIHLSHIKSESSDPGKQLDIIELFNVFAVNVTIEHLSGFGIQGVTGNNVIHLTGSSNARVMGKSVYASNFNRLIRDDQRNVSVGLDNQRSEFMYSGGLLHWQLGNMGTMTP